MEQGSDERPPGVRFSRDNRHCPGGDPVNHLRMNDHRTRGRLLQHGGVPAVGNSPRPVSRSEAVRSRLSSFEYRGRCHWPPWLRLRWSEGRSERRTEDPPWATDFPGRRGAMETLLPVVGSRAAGITCWRSSRPRGRPRTGRCSAAIILCWRESDTSATRNYPDSGGRRIALKRGVMQTGPNGCRALEIRL